MAEKIIISNQALPKEIYDYYSFDKEYTKIINSEGNDNIIFGLESSGVKANLKDDEGNMMFEPFNPHDWWPHNNYYILTSAGKKFLSSHLISKGGKIPTNEWAYNLCPTCTNNPYYYENTVGIKVGELEFGSITGISFIDNNETLAGVEYTLILKNITPFAKIRSVGNTRLSEGLRVHKSIKFRKFDDGWRID
ncbi:MAG: hypothetical protein AMXMBFR79_11180 [Chitinophagaceae bacterium]